MNEKILYLLVTESHLPPRISRDIHSAEKDSFLVGVVQDGGTGVFIASNARLEAPHQLRLD
jgi:hypothetical protein